MVALKHPAPKQAQNGLLVRAVGLEPTLSLRKNGFSYPCGFRRPWFNGQGLESGLSLHQPGDPVEVLPV